MLSLPHVEGDGCSIPLHARASTPNSPPPRAATPNPLCLELSHGWSCSVEPSVRATTFPSPKPWHVPALPEPRPSLRSSHDLSSACSHGLPSARAMISPPPPAMASPPPESQPSLEPHSTPNPFSLHWIPTLEAREMMHSRIEMRDGKDQRGGV